MEELMANLMAGNWASQDGLLSIVRLNPVTMLFTIVSAWPLLEGCIVELNA